jgi:anti-sigma regulatory factor (Ser/Thr protein kinase)
MTVSRRGGPLWAHGITLAPERESVATARRFVREHLTGHDLALIVDDVILVASELATNALRHAGTAFTVTITAFPDDVVLAVEDGSLSIPVLVEAEDDDVVGRGMAIVDVVSRDWGVVVDADGGKSVWAAFDVG